MASKRHLRRRSCESKRRFADQTAAVGALRAMVAAGKNGCRSYRCALCHGWHVGHPPKKIRQAISDRRAQRNRRG